MLSWGEPPVRAEARGALGQGGRKAGDLGPAPHLVTPGPPRPSTGLANPLSSRGGRGGGVLRKQNPCSEERPAGWPAHGHAEAGATGNWLQAGGMRKSGSQKLICPGSARPGVEGKRAQRTRRPDRGPQEQGLVRISELLRPGSGEPPSSRPLLAGDLLGAPGHSAAFSETSGPEEPHPTGEEPPAAGAAGTAVPGPAPHTPRQATASQLTFPWLSMPTKASEVQESCMALKWTAGPLARGRLMAGSSAERGVAEL